MSIIMHAPDAIGAEMPKYQCHKQVWALKIADLLFTEGGKWMIVPEESGYTAFEVPESYVKKHDPQIGGYYVVYKDGYASFSPAAAFEKGYTRT